MTCLEVRERLTEHALGLLAKPDAREVDRHLEWCAGCRKESGELFDGAAAVGLALPATDPPTSLEGRIVERFRVATGRAKGPSRIGVRLLVAATLTAAMLAISAVGWAIAERGKVQSLEERNRANQGRINTLYRLQNNLTEIVAPSVVKNYLATLSPIAGGGGTGWAMTSTAPKVLDLLFVDVVLPEDAVGPFIVQLLDGTRAIRVPGYLQPPPTPDGDWTMYWFTGYNLSRTLSVTILDRTGGTVMTGVLHPYAGA
jgi:Putative zinc-finger